MQPLQICIGPTIRIGRESWGLPYAGFFCLTIKNPILAILAIRSLTRSPRSFGSRPLAQTTH